MTTSFENEVSQAKEVVFDHFKDQLIYNNGDAGITEEEVSEKVSEVVGDWPLNDGELCECLDTLTSWLMNHRVSEGQTIREALGEAVRVAMENSVMNWAAAELWEDIEGVQLFGDDPEALTGPNEDAGDCDETDGLPLSKEYRDAIDNLR